jgi:UDP-glucose 4-epimerase
VTGGAGFIGSHVVDRLVSDGLNVVAVDNLSRGVPPHLNADAAFHEVDEGSDAFATLFESTKPDYVFHLAARASVNQSVRDPLGDVNKNVLACVNVLEQCKRFGVERLIQSSTGGALYGAPQYLPCDEDHPILPRSPYGAGKASVENYISAYGVIGGVDYTILRYGNVYGPRQDPLGEAGVVAIMTNRMIKGEGVIIFGDGEQSRDFVYVGDVVEANMLARQQKINDVFNIGTGVGTTVNAIFKQLAKATDYNEPAKREPANPGEVYKIHLSNAKAREKLGWAPKVDLAKGLAETVAYFS